MQGLNVIFSLSLSLVSNAPSSWPLAERDGPVVPSHGPCWLPWRILIVPLSTFFYFVGDQVCEKDFLGSSDGT
jgi:hypothetical protein